MYWLGKFILHVPKYTIHKSSDFIHEYLGLSLVHTGPYINEIYNCQKNATRRITCQLNKLEYIWISNNKTDKTIFPNTVEHTWNSNNKRERRSITYFKRPDNNLIYIDMYYNESTINDIFIRGGDVCVKYRLFDWTTTGGTSIACIIEHQNGKILNSCRINSINKFNATAANLFPTDYEL